MTTNIPSGSWAWLLGCVVTAAMVLPGTSAGGWRRDEHGAKATAMAQAFTAQADDPSAVIYNPAGLAFLEDRAFAAGFSLGLNSSNGFEGFDPVPGVGVGGERRIEPLPVPHVYWVEPVARRWAVGVALNRGAAFESDWEQPDTWAGRFEARRSRLRAWDLSPVAAVRVHEQWGISAGLIVRVADFSWSRDETGFNPVTQADEPIGLSSLEANSSIGLGAVLGFLYRPDGRWSLGLRWRSEVAVKLDGNASFVQVLSGDPIFDALAAGLLPFGQPVGWAATIRFPERTVFGVAYSVSPTALLEVDLEHSAWGSLNSATFQMTGQPTLDRSPFGGWESRIAARIGLRWSGLGNGEWRAGVFLDPTPQPETNLGPFFVGADRYGASIGFGTRVQRLQTDVALVWEEFDDRSTQTHGFDGRYSTRLLRMALTFGW
jgi:long-chain fatty acid transport protein